MKDYGRLSKRDYEIIQEELSASSTGVLNHAPLEEVNRNAGPLLRP
jgi:hypothetical protein